MRQLDYAAIRKRIPIRHVLELLQWQHASRRGQQWRGSCPLSCSTISSSKPLSYFSVHLADDLFRCFNCHRSGNQLDLWAAVSGKPIYPATLDLCRQLSIVPIALNTQPRKTD